MQNNRLDKIEAYLSGEMPPGERLSFEAEMAANQALSADFRLCHAIKTELLNDDIYKEKDEALKKSLDELSSIYFNKAAAETNGHQSNNNDAAVIALNTKSSVQERSLPLWKKLSAAALAGIICLGVVWYLQNNKDKTQLAHNNITQDSSTIGITTDTANKQQNNQPQNEPIVKIDKEVRSGKNKKQYYSTERNTDKLFTKNFTPDALPENVPDLLADAFISYDNNDFKKAAAAFENTGNGSGSRGAAADSLVASFYAKYYRGICYLAYNNTAKAIPVLSSAINESPDSLYAIKTQWYLALAYIKKAGRADLKNADILLQKVADNNIETSYRQQAAALLEAINKETGLQ